jgi:hypothetical protein
VIIVVTCFTVMRLSGFLIRIMFRSGVSASIASGMILSVKRSVAQVAHSVLRKRSVERGYAMVRSGYASCLLSTDQLVLIGVQGQMK